MRKLFALFMLVIFWAKLEAQKIYFGDSSNPHYLTYKIVDSVYFVEEFYYNFRLLKYKTTMMPNTNNFSRFLNMLSVNEFPKGEFIDTIFQNNTLGQIEKMLYSIDSNSYCIKQFKNALLWKEIQFKNNYLYENSFDDKGNLLSKKVSVLLLYSNSLRTERYIEYKDADSVEYVRYNDIYYNKQSETYMDVYPEAIANKWVRKIGNTEYYLFSIKKQHNLVGYFIVNDHYFQWLINNKLELVFINYNESGSKYSKNKQRQILPIDDTINLQNRLFLLLKKTEKRRNIYFRSQSFTGVVSFKNYENSYIKDTLLGDSDYISTIIKNKHNIKVTTKINNNIELVKTGTSYNFFRGDGGIGSKVETLHNRDYLSVYSISYKNNYEYTINRKANTLKIKLINGKKLVFNTRVTNKVAKNIYTCMYGIKNNAGKWLLKAEFLYIDQIKLCSGLEGYLAKRSDSVFLFTSSLQLLYKCSATEYYAILKFPLNNTFTNHYFPIGIVKKKSNKNQFEILDLNNKVVFSYNGEFTREVKFENVVYYQLRDSMSHGFFNSYGFWLPPIYKSIIFYKGYISCTSFKGVTSLYSHKGKLIDNNLLDVSTNNSFQVYNKIGGNWIVYENGLHFISVKSDENIQTVRKLLDVNGERNYLLVNGIIKQKISVWNALYNYDVSVITNLKTENLSLINSDFNRRTETIYQKIVYIGKYIYAFTNDAFFRFNHDLSKVTSGKCSFIVNNLHERDSLQVSFSFSKNDLIISSGNSYLRISENGELLKMDPKSAVKFYALPMSIFIEHNKTNYYNLDYLSRELAQYSDSGLIVDDSVFVTNNEAQTYKNQFYNNELYCLFNQFQLNICNARGKIIYRNAVINGQWIHKMDRTILKINYYDSGKVVSILTTQFNQILFYGKGIQNLMYLGNYIIAETSVGTKNLYRLGIQKPILTNKHEIQNLAISPDVFLYIDSMQHLVNLKTNNVFSNVVLNNSDTDFILVSYKEDNYLFFDKNLSIKNIIKANELIYFSIAANKYAYVMESDSHVIYNLKSNIRLNLMNSVVYKFTGERGFDFVKIVENSVYFLNDHFDVIDSWINFGIQDSAIFKAHYNLDKYLNPKSEFKNLEMMESNFRWLFKGISELPGNLKIKRTLLKRQLNSSFNLQDFLVIHKSDFGHSLPNNLLFHETKGLYYFNFYKCFDSGKSEVLKNFLNKKWSENINENTPCVLVNSLFDYLSKKVLLGYNDFSFMLEYIDNQEKRIFTFTIDAKEMFPFMNPIYIKSMRFYFSRYIY